jgi:predicted GNAT family acetyltransferase
MSAVRDNTALSRFELDADGVTAIANYQLAGDVMTITHTEVPPRARKRGIASRLMEGMLVPLCPFVGAYFGKHPEDKDLLA